MVRSHLVLNFLATMDFGKQVSEVAALMAQCQLCGSFN